MNTHDLRRKLLLKTSRLVDLSVLVIAFLVSAVYSRADAPIGLGEFLALRVKLPNFLIMLALLMTWSGILRSFGLYTSRRLSGLPRELSDVARATLSITATVFTAAFLFHIGFINIRFLFAFYVLTTVLLICTRLTLRVVLRSARLWGRNLRNMVVVGTNRRCLEFANKIERRPDLGYRVIGFVDEDWPGLKDLAQSGYKVVCKPAELPDFLATHVVDEAVIGLPEASLHQTSEWVAEACEEQGVAVRHLAYNPKFIRMIAEEFDGEILIRKSHQFALEGGSRLLKRTFDFSMALTAALVFLPLGLVLAIAIKLSSRGPVFFTQERIGLNKRRFKMYKFRTMVADAPARLAEIEHLNEATGPVFKIKNDPRVTRLGAFLRKTSLDELPQLVNVLKGQMSLVGPRPLPLRDYDGFRENWHRRRVSVPPGMTCLWQVSGRSSISFDQWMKLDLQYVDRWSIWLDLEILFRTIPAILKGSGAV